MIEWLILILALVVLCLLVDKIDPWADLGTYLFWGAIVVGLWSLWHWRDTPEERAFKEAQVAAERRRRETPHVVREADGCKVYAFESGGRDHFFTRCPASTDTETTWTEYCGKNCKKEMSDHIVQENK